MRTQVKEPEVMESKPVVMGRFTIVEEKASNMSPLHSKKNSAIIEDDFEEAELRLEDYPKENDDGELSPENVNQGSSNKIRMTEELNNFQFTSEADAMSKASSDSILRERSNTASRFEVVEVSRDEANTVSSPSQIIEDDMGMNNSSFISIKSDASSSQEVITEESRRKLERDAEVTLGLLSEAGDVLKQEELNRTNKKERKNIRNEVQNVAAL